MGIDIYMNWHGQSEAEHESQLTGFSITAGNVGYLREAYHGGPYVTRYLVAEAFDDGASEDGVEISAATLRERLPEAIRLYVERCKNVYKEDVDPLTDEGARAFEDFVSLAEKMEAETGRPVKVLASY